MSKACDNCEQHIATDAYSCLACGRSCQPMTRALNAKLFVRALEATGKFSASNPESLCSASFLDGVYRYSIGGRGYEPEVVEFADQASFLAFLTDKGIGRGYHGSDVDRFSGRTRQCRLGLTALENSDFDAAQTYFQTALDLGFHQAHIGMAITASVSHRPEEGRAALERLYAIFQHPRSGPAHHPLNNFFRFVGMVDAQREGLLGDGRSTWSTPQAIDQLNRWWTLLLDLDSAWSGEMHYRRGLAHQANQAWVEAVADLEASIPLLSEECARVAHVHHPTLKGEHKYQGTLFAALNKTLEDAKSRLAELESEQSASGKGSP
jgi:hypothetical protein